MICLPESRPPDRELSIVTDYEMLLATGSDFKNLLGLGFVGGGQRFKMEDPSGIP